MRALDDRPVKAFSTARHAAEGLPQSWTAEKSAFALFRRPGTVTSMSSTNRRPTGFPRLVRYLILPVTLLAGSGLFAQGDDREYVAVYPGLRSVSTTAPLRLSVFVRRAKKITIAITPISSGRFREFSISPWSREFRRKMGGLKVTVPATSDRAHFVQAFRVAEGANYFKLTPALAPGAYLITAQTDRGLQAHHPLLVSDLGLVSKQSGGTLLLYTVDLVRGGPVAGAGISVRSPGTARVHRLRTNSDGIAELALSASGLNKDRIQVTATKDGQRAMLTSGRTPYLDTRYQVFIDTDRPIYKGGHTVQWVALVKNQKKGQLQSVGRIGARAEVLSADGKTLSTTNVRLDAFGKTAGRFTIPQRVGGYFTIRFTVDGEQHQANFLVRDYVKPSMYVQVLPDEPAVVFGRNIAGRFKARYLHGGVPSGGKVSYQVFRGHYRPPAFGISSEERLFDLAGTAPTGQGELITSGEGVLGETGEMEFLIPTKPEHKQSVFTIRARVTVEDGGRVTDTAGGTGSVRVLAGGVTLSARQTNFIIAPGGTDRIFVFVQDLLGKPVADQKVETVIFEEKWDAKSGYGHKTAKVDYVRILSSETKTGSDGQQRVPIRLEKTGRYRVVLRTQDRAGNAISTDLYYWVADESFAATEGAFSELGLESDRRFYRPGETARILVTSSVPDAKVLITAEGDGIYMRRVVRFRGRTHLLSLPLSDPRYVPNLYVTASLVNEGRLVTSALPVFLSPMERFLTTELKTDREQYRPGENVRLKVTTRDAQGKPRAASVAVSVVDEGVFLVQERIAPTIEKFFYGRRPNRTRLTWSFPSIFSGGASKGDPPLGEPDRRGYKDTAYFRHNVETNRKGQGSIEFKLPANLTTWRITAVATDTGRLVGTQVNKFLSTKELIARLSIPRFLNTGSESEAVAIIQNLTQERLQINGTFRAKGVEIIGPTTFRGEVGPAGRTTFRVKLRAAVENPNGAIQFFLSTTDGRLKDSLERRLPVFETGLAHILSSRGELLGDRTGKATGTATLSLAQDPEAKLLLAKNVDLRSLELVVFPNLLSSVLGSIEYLLEYPHGCVEQTTSRFLPNIRVLDFLKANGIRDPRLEKKLREHISAGVTRLQQLQNKQRGGWGWWESRNSYAVNHWMTAYALYGLVSAKNAGFAVEKKSIELGLDALTQMMYTVGPGRSSTLDTSDYPKEESFIVFGNYILTLAGRGDPSITDAVLVVEETATLESLGWAARTLDLEKRPTELAALVAKLRARARDNRFLEKVSQNRPNSSDVYYNSIALSGLLRQKPNEADSAAFVRQLLGERGPDGKFRSTRDTAAALTAILEFLAANRRLLDADLSLDIALPGGARRSVRVRGTGQKEPLRFPVRLADLSGMKLTPDSLLSSVRFQGRGLAQVYLTARLFERTKTFVPTNRGIAVERTYTPEGQDANKAKFTGRVLQGEGLDVLVRLRAGNRSGNYLLVTEAIPPGFVVESQFDYSYGRRNVVVTKDRIYFYVENYGGEETLRYRLRAVNQGSFLVPPATAELMYDDRVNGSSAATVINVE